MEKARQWHVDMKARYTNPSFNKKSVQKVYPVEPTQDT